MSYTPSSLVRALAARVPDMEAVLHEHLEDYDGELLPHIFFGELTQWVLDQSPGTSKFLDDVLKMLDDAYGAGPLDVKELIYVSFLEDLRAGPELLSRFGPNLAADTPGLG